MDELTLLRTLRDDVPDSPAPAEGRSALVRAAHQRSSTPARRRPLLLMVGVAACVGVVAVGATLVPHGTHPASGPGARSGTHHGRTHVSAGASRTAGPDTQHADPNLPRVLREPTNLALLRQTADQLRTRRFTPPRGDQWLLDMSIGGDTFGSDYPHDLGAMWTKFDGTEYVELHDGRLIHGSLAPHQETPLDKYQKLRALPSQPQALLQALRDGALRQEQGRTQADRDLAGIQDIINEYTVVPPDVWVNLYHALVTIPGVNVSSTAPRDLLGQKVLSVTYSGSDQLGAPGSHTEYLFDPRTYAFVGIRETTDTDRTLGGAHYQAGTVWYDDAELPKAVVDRPGEVR